MERNKQDLLRNGMWMLVGAMVALLALAALRGAVERGMIREASDDQVRDAAVRLAM